MSQYCTEQEFEEIVAILEKWIGNHPNPDEEMPVRFEGSDEPFTRRKIYESIRDRTPIGEWHLKEFKKNADEQGISIIEVVRMGFDK